jgi:(4-(4-[2-(gamma-L-glutamylamino)ethyl]phenoxymethyl)furan-2-yl)methanamine synthase
MIGIDVGGANVKIVEKNSVYTHYCPLWKHAPLRHLLELHRGGSSNAAVVMSGELADCFYRKTDGIRWIFHEVSQVFPGAVYYGMDARFHHEPVPELAAANWLVSADFLKDTHPGAVLVDIGSTTTDLIPLSNFEKLKGLTDLNRLQNGYLVYSGMLRTSIPTHITAVNLDGILTPVSTEYFACSGDVHLVLGQITSEQYISDPPDGGEKTLDGSLRRLARVVCADMEEIGETGAREIAKTFWKAQKELIISGINRVCEESPSGEVIFAGIGSSLFSKEYGGTDLAEVLGPGAEALPAYAVREVALRDHIC